MDLGAIFIGFAILVIAVPYVIYPLMNGRKKQPLRTISQTKDEEGSHKGALVAIRDLDFDFQIGKVTQEDYETLRAQLVVEAAEYLQTKKQVDEKIEEMIRARLQAAKPSQKCEKCGGEIRPQDRYCPICGAVAKNQTASNKPAPQIACPGCGKSVKESDMFCTGCGTRLNEKSTARNTMAEN